MVESPLAEDIVVIAAIKFFIVINDNKEIVFRKADQWYNDTLWLYADNVNGRILITTNSSTVGSNFWCYEIDAKQLRAISLNNTNPTISPYSELVFINGNYYFVSGPNKRLCTIDKNLTTITKIYQAECNRFSYDKTNNKLIFVKQNASIKYGTLTPIIENRLTNIQGEPIQISPSQILNGVRMATGSYVGNGRNGDRYPITLSFDFVPKYIAIYAISENADYDISPIKIELMQDMYGVFDKNSIFNVSYYNGKNANTGYIVSWGKTVSFYGTSYSQPNRNGVTYNYIAFG